MFINIRNVREERFPNSASYCKPLNEGAYTRAASFAISVLVRSWHPFWGSPPRCSSSAQPAMESSSSQGGFPHWISTSLGEELIKVLWRRNQRLMCRSRDGCSAALWHMTLLYGFRICSRGIGTCFPPPLSKATSLMSARQCPFRDKWYHSVLCAQIGQSVIKLC